MSGWIKLHRSLEDHSLWKEKRIFSKAEAWIDILWTVNFNDEKVLIGETIIECKRGQSLLSLESWAKRWKWDKSKVRRFFILLQSETMIVTEDVRKTTRLTVCNYEKYQDVCNATETQLKRKRNATETQLTPIKEGEERKEEKKIESVKKFTPPTPDEINSYFLEKGSTLFLASKFFNHYESNGWKVGKNKMQKWHNAAGKWIAEEKEKNANIVSLPFNQSIKADFTIGKSKTSAK